MSEEMSAEFDTVAEWTAEAARRLGDEFFLPAA
ncbi:SAM-dependent methyltransferase, partial [Mycobacterium sp. ITM-2017-0098]